MRISILLKVVVLMVVLVSGVESRAQQSDPDFKYWTWMHYGHDKKDKEYLKLFKKLKDSGIDAVLINTDGNTKDLQHVTDLARKEKLEVHAWIMAMNRPGDKVAQQHPDWYTVSRDGKSCFDTRPYVDYYQWLCPTREASRNHVLSLVEGLATVEGLSSVHLDYIRFCDIFLPIGLLPKYNLEQNTELPEFDFCYCDVCIATFEKMHHKNPLEMEHPELDIEWRQFRLNQIKAVVDDAYEIVHKHNKDLTAAVFPYPEMAGRMVRQRWDKWNIDEVLPMIYHNFYNEELDWVGWATQQGVNDLENTGTKLNTGVYVPSIEPAKIAEAIQLAKENGAKGIAFFDVNALTDEHLKVIKSSKTDR
ncbi:hypothetical protein LVD15_17905 [Fulvivirga maritima]|uniref:putative glycoside hydrolase n=1 Tax=Fulvivirga maritima TaxID=2904247 RepID=UPI001F3A0108|nr:putative glycoside hydrolase [Fulvivirga maritima]UII25171.1 hypothetical protein LVD15_17905 [Fulvivirga maritima]